MPELPEVETIVRDLRKKVLSRTFIDVWTDTGKIIKRPKSFKDFKKKIKGLKIKNVTRRGKNILFILSEGKILLIHQKLTGHLLLGKWKKKNGGWQPPKGPLSERVNTYIHLLFVFENGKMMALSDLRKFAKVELWESLRLKQSPEFRKLGPEPLKEDFTFKKFEEAILSKDSKIKQVLMDQNVIAGIGNIYSDEILWQAKIHPFKRASNLSPQELKKIYQAMKNILKKAIVLRGESAFDYRDTKGLPGNYDKEKKVYQREGETCLRCGEKIKRVKLGGRSAHFCPRCQKL